VPDYYTIIKNPMDLSLMREKLYDGEYTWSVLLCVLVVQLLRVTCSSLRVPSPMCFSVEHVIKDLQLIIDNAEEYNPANERGRYAFVAAGGGRA